MFDVTPQPAAAEATDSERGAFNAAFYELGLRWYWDASTYAALTASADDGSRLRRYIETRQPHLLSAYDHDFLSAAILDAKLRCQRMRANAAPSSMPHVDWTDPRSAEIGV